MIMTLPYFFVLCLLVCFLVLVFFLFLFLFFLSLPSRASCDWMVARPARYILRFTLWVKFSFGLFGKATPPPRQIGLEVRPVRARPVPFWRHGLCVEAVTSARVCCARFPLRALSWIAVTTWCSC